METVQSLLSNEAAVDGTALTGEEPVAARGLLPGTAFIRALVMDATMQGQSSFRAWTPEDATRPRGVTYRLYLDEVTRLR